MAVSSAFATALFLLLATACSPSGKPAAPHRSPGPDADHLHRGPAVLRPVGGRHRAGRDVSPGRVPLDVSPGHRPGAGGERVAEERGAGDE